MTWRADALIYASMLRDGHSKLAIARAMKISTTSINRALQHACPKFWDDRRSNRGVREKKDPRRPEWTYPDKQTLAVVREIRDEIATADRDGSVPKFYG